MQDVSIAFDIKLFDRSTEFNLSNLMLLSKQFLYVHTRI